jgi:hypothetical protein
MSGWALGSGSVHCGGSQDVRLLLDRKTLAQRFAYSHGRQCANSQDALGFSLSTSFEKLFSVSASSLVHTKALVAMRSSEAMQRDASLAGLLFRMFAVKPTIVPLVPKTDLKVSRDDDVLEYLQRGD